MTSTGRKSSPVRLLPANHESCSEEEAASQAPAIAGKVGRQLDGKTAAGQAKKNNRPKDLGSAVARDEARRRVAVGAPRKGAPLGIAIEAAASRVK